MVGVYQLILFPLKAFMVSYCNETNLLAASFFPEELIFFYLF